MRRRTWVLAACVAVWLVAPMWAAPADPPALTMGRLALLRASADASLVPSLKIALASGDRGLRAIAGRIAGVSRIIDVEDDVLAALEREQDDRVAAELVHAALFYGDTRALAAVDAYMPRAGRESLAIDAEHLGRTAPDRLIAALPNLAPRLDADRHTALSGIILMTSAQHPEKEDALLRGWMAVTSGDDWLTWLEQIDGPPTAGEPKNAAILAALDGANDDVRSEFVWQVLDWMTSGHAPAAALVTHAARVDSRAAPDSWEPSVEISWLEPAAAPSSTGRPSSPGKAHGTSRASAR